MKTVEEIIEKLKAKQSSKIAALTTKERADLKRRQSERVRQLIEEAKKTDPELSQVKAAQNAHLTIEEIRRDADPAAFEASFDKILAETPPEVIDKFIENWNEAEYIGIGILDDALDGIRQDKIDQLLDANLKAQNMRQQLDQLTAQGDRIEKTAVETRQGVGVLVSKMPESKKPTVISWAEATAIFYPSMTAKKTNGTFAYSEEKKKKCIESFSRNCRNWIKAKRAPTGTPISWDDLASTQTWQAWVDKYRSDEYKPAIVSEMAGIAIKQRGRKRSPTAQSGK